MRVLTWALIMIFSAMPSFSQTDKEKEAEYRKMMDQAMKMQEENANSEFEVLVRRISGDVKIKSSGMEKYHPVEGTGYYPVDSDDTIKTGSGYAELYFNNSGIVKVDRNTEIEVRTLQQEDTSFFLKTGAIIGKFEKALKKKLSVRIETPVAVCAIRGTEFAVEQSLFNKETTFGVFDEGQIAVTPSEGENGTGGQQDILIDKGSELTLSPETKRVKVVKLSKMMKHKYALTIIKKNLESYKKKWKKLPYERREKLRNELFKAKTSGARKNVGETRKNKAKKAIKKRVAKKKKEVTSGE